MSELALATDTTQASRRRVVAGVLQRPDGTILLAQRPPGKPYAGYWEFPGGKIQPQETAIAALRRELEEELGIAVETAYPWLTRCHDYEHAAVQILFYRVTQWCGVAHGRENQLLVWQRVDAINVAPLLPANGPILRALGLPAVQGISAASRLGVPVFIERLQRALENGLRLVQVREKQMSEQELHDFAAQVIALAHRHAAKVVINAAPHTAAILGADGAHLCAGRLRKLTRRPDVALCGASCHDRAELEHAQRLGLDYAVLSPVQPTLSHPGEVPLGWPALGGLIEAYGLPVYALGGMRPDDLTTAWRHGAHGIAMLGAAWER
ncbi:MAG: Nudix family hydrolase [Burkholderiales bacterium]